MFLFNRLQMVRSLNLSLQCVAFLFFLTAVTLYADDYSTWRYSRKVLLNTTNTGADVSDDVYGFPVLLRLNPANFNFFPQTAAGGADIRFAKTDGTHIPYEIERWRDGPNDGDTAEIWIKIDTLFGNNATQSLLMYWGKSSAGDSSNSSAVFASDNNFAGVWHLGEEGDATADDATIANNDGVAYGFTPSSDVPGAIGTARQFNGKTDYLQINNNLIKDLLSAGKRSATFTFWINADSTKTGNTILWEGNKNGNGWGTEEELNVGFGKSVAGAMVDDYLSLYFGDNDDNAVPKGTMVQATCPYTDTANWHFAAASIDHSDGVSEKTVLYIDGVAVDTSIGEVTASFSGWDTNTRFGRPGGGFRYFKGILDEVIISGNVRSPEWIKLCFENQKKDQTLLSFNDGVTVVGPPMAHYTWDIATGSGIQSGNGIWGSSSFWSTSSGDGTSPGGWPGAGSSATFAGSDGKYSITVSGVQDVDSISFLSSGYTLTGGTLSFGPHSGFYAASGVTDTIASEITGTGGIKKYGDGRIAFKGSNSYTGPTEIYGGRIMPAILADGGVNSGIGRSSAEAANLLLDGGTLRYIGTGDSTNRLFTLGTSTEGARLFSSGSGSVRFTNTGAIAFSGSGKRLLEIGGAYKGSSIFAPVIGDGPGGETSLLKTGGGNIWIITGNNTYTGKTTIEKGTIQIGNNSPTGAISTASTIINDDTLIFFRSNAYTYSGVISGSGAVIKRGADTLTLGGINTYSGATTVTDGVLNVTGTLASGSAVTVAAGATLGGTGTVNGNVAANGATVAPGSGGAGKLRVGALILDSSSSLQIELGSVSDTLAITGKLTLDGTVNFTAAPGFVPATYTFITCGGTLTNKTLTIGTVPAGMDCSIKSAAGSVSATFTRKKLITSGPDDTAVTVGEGAGFAVTVTGSGTITCLWQRYPSDSVGSGTTYIVPTTAKADSNAQFRCIVTDSFNVDTSRWAVLSVNDKPIVAPDVAVQPHDTVLDIGGDATFSVSVTDPRKCSYAWHKSGIDTALGTQKTLTITSCVLADSGRYYCLVTNPVATVSSDTVRLGVTVVVDTPRIALQPHDTALLTGESAAFSVTLTDTAGVTYEWLKVGSYAVVGRMSSYLIDSCKLTDAGRYYCLITSAAATISTDTVRLTVTASITPPRITVQPRDTAVLTNEKATFSVTLADSSGCTYEWWRVDSSKALGTKSVYTITKCTLKDAGRYFCRITNSLATINSDTVRLTVTAAIDTPRIAVQPDDTALITGDELILSVALASAVKCTYAWMKVDSSKVLSTETRYTKESCTLSDAGRYFCLITNPVATISSDTVLVTVTPPAPKARFVVSPENGTPPLKVTFTDSSDGTITSRRWFFGDGETDTVNNPVHHYTKSGLYSVTLVVRGPGGADSLVAKNAVFVFEEGDNPMRIAARFIKDRDAAITISNIDLIDTTKPEPWCDSIGLWVAKDAFSSSAKNETTPAYRYYRSQFKGTSLIDTITLPDSRDSLFYCMTAIYWNDGTISKFKEVNGCTVLLRDTLTKALTSDAVKFTKVKYDSLSGSVTVGWCVDTAKYGGDLEVGFAYSLNGYPDSMAGDQVILNRSQCSETLLELSRPLRADTLYYVTLFLRTPKGDWLAATDSLQKTFRTTRPVREVVSIFTDATGDTVSLFGGQVVLWKNGGKNRKVQIDDTLELYSFEEPESCAVIGTPFKFRGGSIKDTIGFGIRIDALPKNATINDVRIYRDSAGVLTVEHSTHINAARGIVYVQTNDVKHAFVAMIDRRVPVGKLLTANDSIAYPGKNIVDRIEISDNIANVRWKFLYSRGDRVPTVRDSGELSGTKAVCRLTIWDSLDVISPRYGMRALLIYTDGLHYDTLNISRPVFRELSDKFTTEGNVWYPVYASASLLKTGPDSLVKARDKYERSQYDNRFRRVYRWVNPDGTKKGSKNRWVEYSHNDKKVKDLFSLVPGRLFWIKTLNKNSINLGSAHTIPLNDTFTIELAPKEFTDFGSPYNFGIPIGTILSASGDAANDLHFYEWKQDQSSKKYACEPLYIKSIADKKSTSTRISLKNPGGYCIYNPRSKPVTLKIPPTVATIKGNEGSSKKADDQSWCAKLVTVIKGGHSNPALYCGFSPGVKESDYPLAPSFEQAPLYLFDRALGKRQGHYINEDACGGVAKELQIVNTSDTAQVISYHFETAGQFPESFTALLYDYTAGVFVASGEISVAPHSTASRWVVVGDKNWRDSFMTSAKSFSWGMKRLYPNPARSVVTIRYSVGMGADEQVRVTVFDLQGRTVWEKQIRTLLAPGNHSVTWNGHDRSFNAVGAGMYIVRLSVYNSQGKVMRTFDQSLTYFP